MSVPSLPDPPDLSRSEVFLLGLAVVACLVPVWAFHFFPAQDGPVHLHNAAVIRHLMDPDPSVLREYYTIGADAAPSWAAQLALAALMWLFPALVAEKLFVSAVVVGLPLAVAYAARPTGRSGALAFALACPLAYSYPLYMGFYNFAAGVALYFVALGFWLRRLQTDRADIRGWAGLTGLLVVLYFAHPLALVAFLVTALLLTIWFAGTADDGLRPGSALHVGGHLRRLGGWISRLTLAALPGAALLLWYGLQGHEGESVVLGDLAFKAAELVQLTSLTALRREELTLARAFVVLLLSLAGTAAVCKFRDRAISSWDGILLAVAGLAVLYFLVPVPSILFIHDRLNLLIGLLVVLWLGGQHLPRPARRAGVAASVALTLGFLAVRLPAHAGLDPLLDEYVSAGEAISPNSTVAALGLGEAGALPESTRFEWRTNPFFHAAAYLGLDRPVVVLNNYQADKAYFPVRFRPGRSPFGTLWPRERDLLRPWRARILDGSGRGRADYVLVWGSPRTLADDPRWGAVERQLGSGYERAFRSSGGNMTVYRRRGSAEEAPDDEEARRQREVEERLEPGGRPAPR